MYHGMEEEGVRGQPGRVALGVRGMRLRWPGLDAMPVPAEPPLQPTWGTGISDWMLHLGHPALIILWEACVLTVPAVIYYV